MQVHPGVKVELHTIKTTGDRVLDRPLANKGGKGLFVKELELALLDGQIDLAVHSYKDVPVTMPLVDQSDLLIAAVPKRADVRDVAVMRDPSCGPLPSGARVGTSSLRRRCQVLAAIPDAIVSPVRGNIDTRIGKLRQGEFDIMLLAAAGLQRAGLFDPAFMEYLDVRQFLPAPGQGALAIQCCRSDERIRSLVGVLNDAVTAQCVNAERAIVARLNADCHSPVAALAELSGPADQPILALSVMVGAADGNLPLCRAHASGSASDFHQVVEKAFQILHQQGAVDDLARKS